MQNIIVCQQWKHLKTAMETISLSSNLYFVTKEVFLSPSYIYLPITDAKVGPKDQFFWAASRMKLFLCELLEDVLEAEKGRENLL